MTAAALDIPYADGIRLPCIGSKAIMTPHLTRTFDMHTPCEGDEKIAAVVAKLGIGRQRGDHLTGGHLDGRKVVVAIGDGVGNVIEQLAAVVTVVRVGLDNLQGNRVELLCDRWNIPPNTTDQVISTSVDATAAGKFDTP